MNQRTCLTTLPECRGEITETNKMNKTLATWKLFRVYSTGGGEKGWMRSKKQVNNGRIYS